MSYNHSNNLTVTSATISNTGTISMPTSSGTYLITTTGFGGGAGGGGLTYSSSSWSTSLQKDQEDVVIRRKDGKEIRIADSIEMIMETLMLIPRDDKLLEKNPALKNAYEHHQQVIRETICNDKLRESFHTYHTMRRLVEETENE